MSQEFYILLAIISLGQCFQCLLVVMVFVVLSSYLSYESRRLAQRTTNNAPVFTSGYLNVGDMSPNLKGKPAPATKSKTTTVKAN